MVSHIYPTELQMNKANLSDTEAPFGDLGLSITNGIVSIKLYDKRDNFVFEIFNFPFLEMFLAPFLWCIHYQTYSFARECSHVDDFNTRNNFLTSKLLKQGYQYHKLCKAFSKFITNTQS